MWWCWVVALMKRELLDAESWRGIGSTGASVFWLLAEHRRVLFPESLFADLLEVVGDIFTQFA